jgi:hypothetical protein
MYLNFRCIFHCLLPAVFIAAGCMQARADCASETDAEIRAQCERANQAKDSTIRDLGSQTPEPVRTTPANGPVTSLPPLQTQPQPPPTTPAVDIEALVRQACGVRLRPTGAPGERETIVVSAQRRPQIESALGSGGASPVQIESIAADVCFSPLGTDYVLVAPSANRDRISVVGGGDADLSRWLRAPEAVSGRLRLPPDSECGALLDQVRSLSNTAAVWVEQDHGPSRCERDIDGSPHLDPNKVDGYGGVIVLKLQRS